MRHFSTVFAGIVLGRLVFRAVDRHDWETVVIGLTLATVIGIWSYYLSKHEVK